MMTRSFRTVLLSLCLAFSLAAPGHAAEAKFKWSLTTFVPENNPVFTDFVKVFVDRVRELTDGEVEIRPFGAGVIAGAFEGYRAVQKGTADLAFMYAPFITNEDPANAVLGGMPGGMSPQAMVAWLFEGGGEKLWVDFRRETMELHPIIAGGVPTEIFAHSHKPVRKLEDLKGLSLRTAGAWAQIVKGFGATPTVVPPAEIFTMLERRGVDAVEFVTPAVNAGAGYQNVAKYIIVPGVHQPSGAYEVVMRAKVWDSLPERLKVKLRAAGRLATFDSLMRTQSQDLGAIAKFGGGRNEVIVLSPAVLKEMTAASHRWAENAAAEQEKKGSPWMRRIYGSYSRFQQAWSASESFRWQDGAAGR